MTTEMIRSMRYSIQSTQMDLLDHIIWENKSDLKVIWKCENNKYFSVWLQSLMTEKMEYFPSEQMRIMDFEWKWIDRKSVMFCFFLLSGVHCVDCFWILAHHCTNSNRLAEIDKISTRIYGSKNPNLRSPGRHIKRWIHKKSPVKNYFPLRTAGDRDPQKSAKSRHSLSRYRGGEDLNFEKSKS